MDYGKYCNIKIYKKNSVLHLFSGHLFTFKYNIDITYYVQFAVEFGILHLDNV